MNPGSRVIVQNLKSRPELNDTLAVVLRPTPQESVALEKQGRVKITGGSAAISVKAENLVLVDEAAHGPTDWSLSANHEEASSDIASIIVAQLKNINIPDEFVRIMQDIVNHDRRRVPVLQYDAEDANLRSMLLVNSIMHSVHFFRFDQIGHHFILEVHQGKARLFQSFKKNFQYSNGSNSRTFIFTGYSGREWIQPQPEPFWSDDLKETHRRLGGAQELTHTQFEEVLDTIKDIQVAATAITDRYREILPKALVQAEDEWESKCAHESTSNEASPIGAWCDCLSDNPWMVSTALLHDNANNVVMGVNGRNNTEQHFILTFPASIATPFVQAMKRLQGIDPSPLSFIMFFRFRRWKNIETTAIDESTGAAIPVGWTVSTLTIPHS